MEAYGAVDLLSRFSERKQVPSHPLLTIAVKLVSPAAEYYRRDRSQQNFEVEPQRCFCNVFQIEPCPVVKTVNFITSIDLPQARNSRLHT